MKKKHLLTIGIIVLSIISLSSFNNKENISKKNHLDSVVQKSKPSSNKEYFDKVYDEFPNLPIGILESMSYTITRINHYEYESNETGKYYGIMGLMQNEKLNKEINIDSLSKKHHISERKIKEDPYTNIRAVALWINDRLKNEKKYDQSNLNHFKDILKDYSGIPELNDGTIFLRQDFVFQIFRYMKDGILKDGIVYVKPNNGINLNTLFEKSFLKIYDVGKISLSFNDILDNNIQSKNSTDYPPALWVGTDCFGSRNGTQITDVAIHDLEGYYNYEVYEGMQNCNIFKSSHYVIRSSDGFIAQLVNESEKAWHIGNANSYSIGIEHEGFASDPIWYTNSMYSSSAALVSDITSSGYNIDPLNCYTGPANPNGILDVLIDCVQIKGHTHYPTNINTNSHFDPGENWDWFFYYGLINDNPITFQNTGLSGEIFDSGGGNGSYSDLEHITYKINPGYSNVSLSIDELNISDDDYIWIFDKPNPSILPNNEGDIPILDYKNGSLSDLEETNFTSVNGGFYIVFRSNCSNSNSGYKFSWNTNNANCNDNYEPNNSQSQATLLPSIGKGFSTYGDLDACLSYSNIYEDWYLVSVTAQGRLNITLTNQTDNFDIELYSLGASSPFDQGVLQSNGDVTLDWCSYGNACIPLYIRIFKEQFSTPPTNPNYNYNLILDWNYNENCKTSVKQENSFSNQNNNIIISGETSICLGESTTLTASGGSGNYQWFLNENQIGTGSSITVNNFTEGINAVNVVDTNSACLSGSINVNVTSEVTANAGPNVTIQSEQSTQLQGSGGSSCSWSPSTGLSNSNSCNPTASPSQTTTYTLTVTENGCIDTDTVTITVNGSNGNPPPNDDCNNAIILTSNISCNAQSGTVAGATPSIGANNCLGCSCTSPDDYDVYYKFIAVETSHTVTVSNYASNFDAVIELRTSCSSGSSNYISCYDPNGAPSSVSETWDNLSVGQAYYIRVFEWNYLGSPPNSPTFDICVTHNNTGGQGIDLISNITNISNSNPDVGDNINVTFTITNNGDEGVNDAFVGGVYLSTNQTYDSSDNIFPGSPQGFTNISIGQTLTINKTITIPNVDNGQYYILSNPDIGNNVSETEEDNNYSSHLIQIGEIVQSGPDLDVKRVRAVPDTGLVPGQEVEIEIKIENEGNEDSNSFDVLVYLDINGNDDYDNNEFMGVFTFNSLDTGEDDTMFVDFDLPTNIPSAGMYELFVLADSNNEINETNENNNDKDDNVIIALTSNGAEDITVINSSVTETSVNAGGTINVMSNHIYLGNQTSSDLPTLRLGYYLSTDCDFSYAEDVFLDDNSSNLGINNPNIDEDDTLTIPISTPAGTYYILFVADSENLINEGVLENNNVECIQIAVNGSSTPEGDIYITDETCNPYDVVIGSEIEPFANINYSGNQLNANLPSIEVFYFLSDDCILSNDDMLLDDVGVSLGSDLAINDVSRSIELPNNLSTGIYYIILRADMENAVYEINENNNIACSEFNLLPTDSNYQDVTLNNPFISATEANAGDQIYVSVHQNYTGYQTDADLSSVRLKYYLSTDCVFSPDDYYFGYDVSSIGNDDPSQFEYADITIPTDINSGTYYILFIADSENIVNETNEDNNLECIEISINNSTLGIDDNELNNQIKIHPNPVDDILNINLGKAHQKTIVQLVNILGQEIINDVFKSQQYLEIETTKLPIGLYFLRISTDKNGVQEFKIIKE